MMIEEHSKWPKKSKPLAIELHRQLSLNNNNWHQLKNDSDRRAAELLAGAMVQLLSNGNSSDVNELINQSLRWLKREIKAPRCPDH